MAVTEKYRQVQISSPLGEDALLFSRLQGEEALGRGFDYELELLSKDGSIKPDQLLGQSIDIRLLLPEDRERYFNGIVCRFSQHSTLGDFAVYKVSVRPWTWLLTRTTNCRIFQQKTVPDIVKQVFRDRGFTDFKEQLSKTYRVRDYCVQYRETDLNFVNRLMEEEGIYYFFAHEKGKHTLVMADSQNAHQTTTGYETVPYFEPGNIQRERDHIFDWSFANEIQPGCCVIRDYDPIKPKTKLESKSNLPQQHPHGEMEVYDYPGEYLESADGDHYSRVRIEELQAQYELAAVQASARGLACGALFELTDFPREDQNREYLIVSNHVQFQSNAYLTGGGGPDDEFLCRMTVLNSKTPYRAPRETARPIVRGPQTAVVVGPGGDEIYTDQYGRVKVQFHWDREGKKDEKSSCWVRVSHPWAGKNWGMVAIPRIGQEVIVDFLEGDPDQPIITGRVYNADQMPPYALPANMTQTGILSRSSKGGSGANCNELRFEDKKGSEQVFLHAEKNQDIEVENDETHWVGHDRRKTIDHDETTMVKHDRTETVGNNETITIGVNRVETVGSNETITIGANRTESVGQNETITVALTRNRAVGVNEAIAIGAAQEIAVGAARVLTVGANQSTSIGANLSQTVGSNHSLDVGSNQSINVGSDQANQIGKNQTSSVGENRSASVGKDDSHKVGKNLVIDAGDSVTIKTGKASITMKKDGTITIQGKDITIKGSGEINAKADKDVVIKGKNVLQN